MRASLAALVVAMVVAAAGCSSDGGDGTGIPHGSDAGADAGIYDGGTPEDAGYTHWDGGRDAEVDGGADAGGDASDDAGADAGRPLAAIQVDTATVLKTNEPLVNGAGLEVENNAQGLGAEMLIDRGFEWDRGWLQSKGWETWYFFVDQGVNATVTWDTTRVYQGTHSFKIFMIDPVVGKNAGIAQGGLGVVKDRTYTFSFWIYHEATYSQSVSVAMLDVPDPNDPSKTKIIVNPVTVMVDPAGDKWHNYTVDLRPNASTATGAVAFLVPDVGTLWLDAFSLTPKDSARGVWKELVDAFSEAKIAAVRLGGISADGYDWGMGLGPRDKRGVYRSAFANSVLDTDKSLQYMPVYNDVGTDEFLDFCRAIGAEALVTASIPLGSQAAANWVEYTNGTSPGLQKGIDDGWKPESWGSADKAPAGYFAWLREFYGHKNPWGVRYWEIGNEIWDEDLPEPGSIKGAANLTNYAVKAREFATAMKAVDSAIVVGANAGPLPYPPSTDYRSGWNAKVLEVAGDSIDYLAPHFYAPGDFDPTAVTPEQAFTMIAGTGPFYAQGLGRVQSDIDTWKSGSGAGRDVKVAVTEYNVWHGVLKNVNRFDVNRLRSAIANATYRNANLRGTAWMGNFYSLVNHPFGMLDWDAESKAAGTPLLGGNWLLQKLLADHFAANGHPVNVQAPTYTATWDLAGQPPIEASVLDVTAATDDAGDVLTIIAVNRAYWHPEGIRTAIDLGQFAGATAKAHVLTGTSQYAYNSADKRSEIYVVDEDVPVAGSQFEYTFKQYSVTALEIRK